MDALPWPGSPCPTSTRASSALPSPCRRRSDLLGRSGLNIGDVLTPEVRDALASVKKDLMANKGRVCIGMSAEEADRATPGAAKHVTQRFLPLQGSWLDEKSRMNGTIVWEVDVETGEKVDLVCAVLLPGPFDRKDVEKTIVEVGKKIGLDMAPDEADPNTWYDAEAEGLEVWVTLGDGIVVVDCSVVPE